MLENIFKTRNKSWPTTFFFFFWNVFKKCRLQVVTNCDCLIKSYLTHSHTVTSFDAPGKQAFLKTLGKGEIAHNEQFLLFPQRFLPVWVA